MEGGWRGFVGLGVGVGVGMSGVRGRQVKGSGFDEGLRSVMPGSESMRD